MKFIVKFSPEIIMKRHSVRKRFVRILEGNILRSLQTIDASVAVVAHWDYIEVRRHDPACRAALRQALGRIGGVHHVLEAHRRRFESVDALGEWVYEVKKDELAGKSFCVRVKRRGKHDFTSMDVARKVGGLLNGRISSARVQLKNPDAVVHIEIENDTAMLARDRFEGLGGFPMATQEDVLSLISGGFDSSVASFLLMRRGSRVHYCFFNLGGQAHEAGVKQMAYRLWRRYSVSHKVRFIAVDFAPIVAHIVQHTDDGYMGVILKRAMMRTASALAQRFGVQALVTGEALGQVSSQTLTNLRCIDEAATCLVLRPLIGHDKEEIVRLSEKIGSFAVASSMPEFCAVISKSPTVKARPEAIAKEEAKFDFALIDRAIKNAKVYDIRNLLQDERASDPQAVYTDKVAKDEILIDVRAPGEAMDAPVSLLGVTSDRVLRIPFYALQGQFAQLDGDQNYVLYCAQGVMSGLLAAQLMASGYRNVKAFRIAKKTPRTAKNAKPKTNNDNPQSPAHDR